MKKYILILLFIWAGNALANAVTLKNIKYNKSNIHIIEIQPQKTELKIAKALDGGIGRENTLSIALREKAIAAINGSFFDIDGRFNGLPAFMMKNQNQIFVSPNEYNIAYLTTEGNTIRVTKIKADPKIHIGNRYIACSINMPQNKDNIVVYTNSYNKSTLSNPRTHEITVIGNKVTRISNYGNSIIPENGFVISTINTKFKATIGSAVRLDYGLPQEIINSNFVISGSDILLSDNIVSKQLIQNTDFYKSPYARSAICKMKNGHVGLFAVDNSMNNNIKTMTVSEMIKFFISKGYSRDKLLTMNMKDLYSAYYKINENDVKYIGMSLKDFAIALQKHGCTDAINLDGGSSTTMIFKDRILAGAKPKLVEVADAIIVRLK